MTEYEQILKVKEDAEARLRTIPGVHAVGVGRKVVGGEPTDELSIVVFLVNKKPLDRLAPEEVVPPEIDGVLTDVVEMEVPRLMMAAPPLVAEIKGLTVTFKGIDPPGKRLLVVLSCTSGPIGAAQSPSYVHLETKETTTLAQIALAFATKIKNNSSQNVTDHNRPLGFTAPFTATPLLTLIPNPGNACKIIDCIAISVDNNSYDYLRGGIQIQAGDADAGTLGLLATTALTTQDPQGKVVAITNQHVVALPTQLKTNLACNIVNNTITFHKDGMVGDPIVQDTLVVVNFSAPNKPSTIAFYGTRPGDTLGQIAKNVKDTISSLSPLGLAATHSPTDPNAVTVATGGTPQCLIFGPPNPGKSDLHAKVVGLTIELTGQVLGDDYGIFTKINPGGVSPTFGVYYQPAKGAALSDIAKGIAKSITDLTPHTTLGNVTVDPPSGAQINFHNAQAVECNVISDCRVGQPNNSFNSLPFCNHRIGRVIDARIDVDTAIIQLDAGQKYKLEIEGFGALTGFHPELTDADKRLSLAVLKRGKTTLLTHGIVADINTSGGIINQAGLYRQYTNAIHITSSDPSNPFSTFGDSGAAVVTADRKVVGILFGGNGLNSLVTPIEQILEAFPSLALNVVAPAPGQAPSIVPKSAMATVAPTGQAVTSPAHFLGQRLAQAEREITATPAGTEVAEIVKRHFAETQHLVNSNRRVTTVWHRNGGPRLLEAVLRVLQRRDNRLPEEIDGRPFAECLERIKSVLARYASPALAADLARFSPRLEGLSGFTYAEVLSALQAGGAE